MYLILFLFYFIFVFTVEILKSGVSVSLSTCVCDRARVCVRVCERVSVELLSKTHTSNKSNVTTGRKRDGDTPPPAPLSQPQSLSLLMMTNSRLLNMFSVCVFVQCKRRRCCGQLPPISKAEFCCLLSLSATTSFFCWHTRTSHTPPQQLCTSLCVCVRLLI